MIFSRREAFHSILQTMGGSIDQLVNDPVLKKQVYRQYKIYSQYKRIQDAKDERLETGVLKAQRSWHRSHALHSYSLFKLTGDMSPVVQKIRSLILFCRKWGIEIIVLILVLNLMRSY